MWSRRRFLKAAALATGGGLGLYTWRVEPHWVEFVRRRLPVASLPPALDGAVLVQLSDLHVGPSVDSRYVIDVLQRVSALDPDVVAFTGDFITYGGPAQLDEIGRVLEHMPLGRLGTVGILGNHDYGPGWASWEIAAAVERRAGEAGVTLLRNSAIEVAGLTLVGLDDFWGPNFNARTVLGQLRPEQAALVLSHNPDAADCPVWSEFRGWILSGHTHGGQCKPPFLPPLLLPVANRAYTAGPFDLADGRNMYINRGVGHLLRVRFNVRPEVTVFTLQAA